MAVFGAPTIPFARVLVTGGDGFVGRHLVPALAARLAEDSMIALATRMPAAAAAHRQIAFDLKDPESVFAAVDLVRPDLVVHLAAQASVGQSLAAAADTWSVNLCGSLSLAQAIAKITPNCTVLQISSAEVYGATFNDGVAAETSPLRPQSVYARTKAAAEAMFADVLPSSSRLINARPANHSGPGQDERFVIPSFAAQIARIERGEANEIRVGNLDAERDFLDVRDVVSAYLAMLTKAPELSSRTIFNIASGQTTRIGEILSRLRAMSLVETIVAVDSERMRPSEIPRAAIDNGAVRKATNWSPTRDIDMMLEDVLAEMRGRPGQA